MGWSASVSAAGGRPTEGGAPDSGDVEPAAGRGRVQVAWCARGWAGGVRGRSGVVRRQLGTNACLPGIGGYQETGSGRSWVELAGERAWRRRPCASGWPLISARLGASWGGQPVRIAPSSGRAAPHPPSVYPIITLLDPLLPSKLQSFPCSHQPLPHWAGTTPQFSLVRPVPHPCRHLRYPPRVRSGGDRFPPGYAGERGPRCGMRRG